MAFLLDTDYVPGVQTGYHIIANVQIDKPSRSARFVIGSYPSEEARHDEPKGAMLQRQSFAVTGEDFDEFYRRSTEGYAEAMQILAGLIDQRKNDETISVSDLRAVRELVTRTSLYVQLYNYAAAEEAHLTASDLMGDAVPVYHSTEDVGQFDHVVETASDATSLSAMSEGDTVLVINHNAVYELDESRSTPHADGLAYDPDEDGNNEGVLENTETAPLSKFATATTDHQDI